jgi:hypothetical protein
LGQGHPDDIFESLPTANVEHEKRIAVLVFHLPGGFTVHGSDRDGRGEHGVEKLGKGSLQFVERDAFENAGDGTNGGNTFFSKRNIPYNGIN